MEDFVYNSMMNREPACFDCMIQMTNSDIDFERLKREVNKNQLLISKKLALSPNLLQHQTDSPVYLSSPSSPSKHHSSKVFSVKNTLDILSELRHVLNNTGDNDAVNSFIPEHRTKWNSPPSSSVSSARDLHHTKPTTVKTVSSHLKVFSGSPISASRTKKSSYTEVKKCLCLLLKVSLPLSLQPSVIASMSELTSVSFIMEAKKRICIGGMSQALDILRDCCFENSRKSNAPVRIISQWASGGINEFAATLQEKSRKGGEYKKWETSMKGLWEGFRSLPKFNMKKQIEESDLFFDALHKGLSTTEFRDKSKMITCISEADLNTLLKQAVEGRRQEIIKRSLFGPLHLLHNNSCEKTVVENESELSLNEKKNDDTLFYSYLDFNTKNQSCRLISRSNLIDEVDKILPKVEKSTTDLIESNRIMNLSAYQQSPQIFNAPQVETAEEKKLDEPLYVDVRELQISVEEGEAIESENQDLSEILTKRTNDINIITPDIIPHTYQQFLGAPESRFGSLDVLSKSLTEEKLSKLSSSRSLDRDSVKKINVQFIADPKKHLTSPQTQFYPVNRDFQDATLEKSQVHLISPSNIEELSKGFIEEDQHLNSLQHQHERVENTTNSLEKILPLKHYSNTFVQTDDNQRLMNDAGTGSEFHLVSMHDGYCHPKSSSSSGKSLLMSSQASEASIYVNVLSQANVSNRKNITKAQDRILLFDENTSTRGLILSKDMSIDIQQSLNPSERSVQIENVLLPSTQPHQPIRTQSINQEFEVKKLSELPEDKMNKLKNNINTSRLSASDRINLSLRTVLSSDPNLEHDTYSERENNPSTNLIFTATPALENPNKIIASTDTFETYLGGRTIQLSFNNAPLNSSYSPKDPPLLSVEEEAPVKSKNNQPSPISSNISLANTDDPSLSFHPQNKLPALNHIKHVVSPSLIPSNPMELNETSVSSSLFSSSLGTRRHLSSPPRAGAVCLPCYTKETIINSPSGHSAPDSLFVPPIRLQNPNKACVLPSPSNRNFLPNGIEGTDQIENKKKMLSRVCILRMEIRPRTGSPGATTLKIYSPQNSKAEKNSAPSISRIQVQNISMGEGGGDSCSCSSCLNDDDKISSCSSCCREEMILRKGRRELDECQSAKVHFSPSKTKFNFNMNSRRDHNNKILTEIDIITEQLSESSISSTSSTHFFADNEELNIFHPSPPLISHKSLSDVLSSNFHTPHYSKLLEEVHNRKTKNEHSLEPVTPTNASQYPRHFYHYPSLPSKQIGYQHANSQEQKLHSPQYSSTLSQNGSPKLNHPAIIHKNQTNEVEKYRSMIRNKLLDDTDHNIGRRDIITPPNSSPVPPIIRVKIQQGPKNPQKIVTTQDIKMTPTSSFDNLRRIPKIKHVNEEYSSFLKSKTK